MIRLFIQFYSGMILALLAAGLFIVWLLNNPIGDSEGRTHKTQMIYAAQVLVNRIANTDEAEWNSVVDRHMEYFDFSVLWRPLDDPQLSESQRNKLLWGQPVMLQNAEGGQQVFLLLPGTKTVVGVAQRNPLQNPYPEEILMAGGGVLFIVGAIGLVLVITIVRRLKALEWASKEFGQGNWSIRADNRKADAISNLAGSFNSMAAQIENLIEEKNLLLQDQQELLQAVAHEFRAPMSRLNFALHMMAEDNSIEPNSELCDDMERSLTDLNNLVSEVLGYTRLQPGTPHLKTKDVIIDDSIRDIVQQHKKFGSNIQIDLPEPTDKPICANVDHCYFQRAVSNLVTNAISHARQKIRVTWRLIDNHFVVCVEDDGEGIPMDKREHLFKPFTRLDPSRSRNSGGMGLGLAIVKRISQKHLGAVFVDDSSLGGALFELCWPINFTANQCTVQSS